MNLWAMMLADLPALGQRQIARFNRVSLPHQCRAEQRLALLRRSLCHQATVRAAYGALDVPARAALQYLRTQRGGLSFDDLQQRYGHVRSWRQIAADLQPQSIAERLLLHGWLLPRPPAPHHPPRWIVPPEVRRWLPAPLDLPVGAPAPVAAAPGALRVATTLLLLCNEQPQPVRSDSVLRGCAMHMLTARLQPWTPAQAMACATLITPLLSDLGLLTLANGVAATTPAGRRFLSLPPTDQLARLLAAWVAAPRADRWLIAVAPATAGIDWPLLRRRLIAWAEALPPDQLLDLACLYPALAAALGPLADTHTHGFRFVDRAPWQPRRAASVWQVALDGPLMWLGYIAQADTGQVFRPSLLPLAPPVAADWALLDDGRLQLPHGDPDTLRLQPFARWFCADASATNYQISAATLARARSAGHDLAHLRAVLAERAGPLPAHWHALLEQPPALRIADGAVVLAETPALLDRAAQSRSVRRALGQRLAPGLALTSPEQRAALVRALERQGIAVESSSSLVPGLPGPSSLNLHPGECAALIEACAAQRRAAPATETPVLDQVEQRLRAAVPQFDQPPRTLAGDIHQQAQLPACRWTSPSVASQPSPPPVACPPPSSAPIADPPLVVLRNALVARRPVRISYITESADPTERIVRPLELHLRGDTWYLHAFCSLRNAERVFRLDRISAAGFA